MTTEIAITDFTLDDLRTLARAARYGLLNLDEDEEANARDLIKRIGTDLADSPKKEG